MDAVISWGTNQGVPENQIYHTFKIFTALGSCLGTSISFIFHDRFHITHSTESKPRFHLHHLKWH